MLKDNQTTSPCIVAQNITEKKNSEVKNKKLFITTNFFFFFYTHQYDKLYKTNEHKWGHLIFKSFSRVKLTNTNTEWPNNYYTLFLNTLIQRVHLIGFACHQFQKCRGKLVKSGGACFQRWGWWRLKRVVEISTRTIVMLIMTFLSIEPFFLS